MKQEITQEHWLDNDGNPTGGKTTGVGISIVWQHGPLGTGEDRKPPNGAFVEGVIAAAIGRLEYFQTASAGKFSCVENTEALNHLNEAMNHLQSRTDKRTARGVEGTNET